MAALVDDNEVFEASRHVIIVARDGETDRDSLSAVGHFQAACLRDAVVGATLRRNARCRVVSSPALSCIQSAVLLARGLAQALEIDALLDDVEFSIAERYAYFPEILLGAAAGARDDKDVAFFARRLLRRLDAESFPSTTLVVARAALELVEGLTRTRLDDRLVAPAGAFVLARWAADEPFRILRHGATPPSVPPRRTSHRSIILS